MADLAKCPFCGGNAHVVVDPHRNCYSVMCSKCRVRTSPMWYGKTKGFHKKDFGEVFENGEEARQRAIEIWNTRKEKEG